MTVRRPRFLLVALLALLALAAAGCGGGAGAVPELTSLDGVAQKSSTIDSARFEMSLELAPPGSDKRLRVGASGGLDARAGRASLSLDLSALAGLAAELGPSLGGAVKGDLGRPDAWKLDVIQDGGTVYIRFPLLAGQLPAGKSWIRGDAKDLSSAGAGPLNQLGPLAGADPRGLFSFLEAVSGPIEAVGSDELRGVETSHYRTTIDVAKLTRLVPADRRRALGGMLAQAGLAEIPLEVWIDAEQRLRKLVLAVDATPQGSGERLEASLTMELFDYGAPLALELPPADEVVDASALKRLSAPS